MKHTIRNIIIPITLGVFAAMGALVPTAYATGYDHHDPEPTKGSITVCKIIADGEGIIVDGAQASTTTFSLAGRDFAGTNEVPSAASVIATSIFTTPLSFNADLLGADDVNDAQCTAYQNLELGSYFYQQEEVLQETGWNTPRYNDQHTIAVADVYDFFPYSGELFTETPADDAARNTNADGHILLTESRPHRTLVVLNTLEREANPPCPACSDEADNDGDGKIDAQDPACHTDGNPQNEESYDPSGGSENSRPVITVLGANPFSITKGTVFSDPGAKAEDDEDGIITDKIVFGGNAVSTSTVGTSTLSYNVTDSAGLAAEEKTRIVRVTEVIKQNAIPVITRIGNETVSITKGTSFTDPGATASDEEDGDITDKIVKGGDVVDTNTVGTYRITYNVTDSNGAAANQVTRTVLVENAPTGGGGGGGGGGSGGGGSSSGGGGGGSGGGGGGGTKIFLEISNEAVTLGSNGAADVTWNTNLQATSMVVYDTASHGSPTTTVLYTDYAFKTPKSTMFVTSHRITVYGLSAGTTYYFRPYSDRSDDTELGIELTITPTTTTALPATVSATTTQTAILPCTEYLTSYIKLGEQNNETDVRKLEAFLKTYGGFTDLPVDGVYDERDFDAVSAFQEKYFDDVLRPWGHDKATGYVYYTTRKKINEIYCNAAFPLNAAQLAEITNFKAFLESVLQSGGTREDIDTSSVGQEPNQTSETDIAAGQNDNSAIKDILATPITEPDNTTDNNNLVARAIDAITDRTRVIGIALIILAISIACIGILRARKKELPDDDIYPPIS